MDEGWAYTHLGQQLSLQFSVPIRIVYKRIRLLYKRLQFVYLLPDKW
jgi:hypothetical protein